MTTTIQRTRCDYEIERSRRPFHYETEQCKRYAKHEIAYAPHGTINNRREIMYRCRYHGERGTDAMTGVIETARKAIA